MFNLILIHVYACGMSIHAHIYIYNRHFIIIVNALMLSAVIRIIIVHLLV